MALSISDAYQQIKDLEDAGTLNLPQTQETVAVGTIDPKAGTFSWAVPTMHQTIVIPPVPPQKTNTIIDIEVGVVNTSAVDLRLRFDVIPQPGGIVATQGPFASERAASAPIAPAPAASAAADGTIAAEKLHLAGLGTTVGTGLFGETNGGVTIAGFPTVESAADHITVDVGLLCSRAIQSSTTSPPVSRIPLTIDIPDHQQIEVNFFVLRPPVVGMGVFSIPALPMTIVYAPPQGQLKRNTATYQDTTTVSRSVTTSITQSTNVKTVQAYSASDLIGKVAGAIGAVVAVVGTGGAGAAAGALAAGGALAGGAKDSSDGTVDALKGLQAALGAVKTVLDAVDDPTGTMSQSVATQDDHTLSLTVTNMSQYGSASALGPGAGDRIVYLKDVKVVWMAVDGEVGIHVLGAAGIGANAVADLMQEKALLQAGASPTLGLDLDTIDSLLNADPIVAPARRKLDWLGAARIAPPRFEPANPAGRNGSGTSSSGDVFQVSYEVGDGTKHVSTSSTTRITDNKPGWGAVLFGVDDNVDTTTTSTFTTTQTTEDKSSDKTVSTVTMVSAGHDDPYDVELFYDNLFGTYCVIDSNSSLIHGSTVVVGNLHAATFATS